MGSHASQITETHPLLANNTPIATTLPSIQAWNGQRRFTVLLMGLDRRADWVDTGRSDSIMVLSIDPKTRNIGMLSIPRDLFVAFPGQPGLNRINTAFVEGELQKPGGGPEMTMQTIQYNFGIPINSYITVQFDAVIGLVNAIGGVDINVPVTIDDPTYPDMNYGFDPLHIPAGLNHMDGQLALKYARTRHQSSDYDRADRQQQVLLAIRQKVVKPDVLVQLLPQAPTIWQEINQWVNTDMTLDQMLSIAWYAKDIPSTSIHRDVVQGQYVDAIQYNGEGVVSLNRSTIAQLMQQVFGSDYNKVGS